MSHEVRTIKILGHSHPTAFSMYATHLNELKEEKHSYFIQKL